MQSNEDAVYDAIKDHFQCDKRPHRRTGIRFMALLIIALLKRADSSLAQWSLAINQTTLRSSRLKRLQRFFGLFNFSARVYAQVVWQRYGQGKEVILTLDRTEYKKRGEWIQLLVLGIAHQNMSIPLLWHSANRQGNSPTIARKTLLKAFQKWIQSAESQLVYITSDREFVGPEFRDCGLIPLIRIRANAIVTQGGKKQRVSTLFDTPTWRILRQPRHLYKSRLYLSGMRLSDGDYLIVYSDRYLSRSQPIYARRWQIETLFGAFKSRGFDLTKHHRIRRLLFLLSMSLIWALETGAWLVKTGHQIPIRKLGDRYQTLLSLFRHGLDELRDRILNGKPIGHLLPLLSCT
jgi:hypothetical protein